MLTEKLTSIADAIREKGGTTEKLTLDAMPNAIAAIETGGGELEIPVLTGNMGYYDYNGVWDWFVNAHGNKITTANISDMSDAFQNCQLETIPFEINCKTDSSINWMYAFNSATQLKEIGKINYLYPNYGMYLFKNCIKLRNLPEIETFNFDVGTYNRNIAWFADCYSLRSVPEDMLKKIYATNLSFNFSPLYEMFMNCYTIDEIVGINPRSKTFTSNALGNTFANCHRVKNIIFATNSDGTPYTAEWKNKTIDLHSNVGWDGVSTSNKNILNYNSGITSDKLVSDAASYAALKDDPDWYTNNFLYSRFNHDSAVNLINSLPDTSAYLATQTSTGGTNTIIFRNDAGGSTDGGSCGSLTEEEIAVATAKGWTISYAT